MKQQSKYAKVSTAKAQRVGNHLRPGHYLLLINSVTEGEAFKKGTYVAIEATVLKDFGDGPRGFDYARKVELPSHTPGEDVSDVCMLSNVAFESRMKAFAMVAGNLTEKDFIEEAFPGAIIEELVGETQPVAGAVVEVRADTKVKREAKAKPESALTSEDIYTQIGYVRRVPLTEVKELVDDRILARFLPDIDKDIQAN